MEQKTKSPEHLKKLKQLRNKSPEQLVEEIKKINIGSWTNELVLPEPILKVIKPIISQQIVQQNEKIIQQNENEKIIQQNEKITEQHQIFESLNNPRKSIELLNSQITCLTETITILEEQILELIVVIDKLSKLVDCWKEERQLLKKIIVIDEDIIQQNLEDIIQQNLKLIYDESKASKIKKSIRNARIVNHSNKIEQLLLVELELSQTKIILSQYQQALDNFESTVADYRLIRLNMSKDLVKISESILEQESKLNPSEVTENLKNNFNKLNQIDSKLFHFKMDNK